jgi:hypothetical protein
METEPQAYLHALTQLYFRLPETPRRLSRYDRQVALEWFQQQIPLPVVEAAFLLASVRRTSRPPQARPLGPVRSLAYFQPVIEEVLQNPPPASYLAYLRSKLPLTSSSPQ